MLLEEARSNGTLGARARIAPAASPPEASPLLFPGKVLSMPGGGLAVSDSGHHRVLLLEEDGKIKHPIGSGQEGLEDGPAAGARFTRPQGLAIDGGILYVADAGNHALRAVDLETFRVETAAGDGTLGQVIPWDLTPARELALRSPWDLVMARGFLLIAMAGTHQIWAYLPGEKTMAVFAGTGRESIDDGRLDTATFSQPTGLTIDGRDRGRVYVADSETSAIRCLDLDEAQVTTIVGKGLFDFGDIDGPPELARMQHVQDVAWGPNGLLVADTYNDKIKRVDPATGTVETWFSGDHGRTLSEPAGLHQLPDGRVAVADTNHHRLVLIDGQTGQAQVLDVDLIS
ncbi:MAG: hypothetical protein ACE5JI_08060, partial [Acidobacteriota bacterium]